MRNPTNEYMLPVSFGLLEHLPKFGCNPTSIYFWLHFNKTVKGPRQGYVNFTLAEISELFGVSKSTVHRCLLHLKNIEMIEWVSDAKNQHKNINTVIILKDKTIKDFNVLWSNQKIKAQQNCIGISKNGNEDSGVQTAPIKGKSSSFSGLPKQKINSTEDMPRQICNSNETARSANPYGHKARSFPNRWDIEVNNRRNNITDLIQGYTPVGDFKNAAYPSPQEVNFD